MNAELHGGQGDWEGWVSCLDDIGGVAWDSYLGMVLCSGHLGCEHGFKVMGLR